MVDHFTSVVGHKCLSSVHQECHNDAKEIKPSVIESVHGLLVYSNDRILLFHTTKTLFEPRCEKTSFLHMRKQKTQ